ncbi:MAG: glycosyltransferase family 4 protein [Candidatus Marinimicrobia bacterium]|jgi:glycosyltransferase involved in cell wall biosynthesis|nr:glycosyltransferase family 4 protein [Candidatus Neomarinimicrobiota bacterium]
MIIIYPFPMHLSQGYSYMLSITQFVNSLAKSCRVDLLCLDSTESLSEFYRDNLSEEVSEALNIVKINNRCCGIRSNSLFFFNGVRRYVSKLLSEGENVVVYSRDYKQMEKLIGSKWGVTKPYFVFESHQIQSQNLCRSGRFKDAERLRDLESKVFSDIDAIVPITQTLSNEISRVFPKSTNQRVVLPVGVSEKFFNKENIDKKYDLIYSGNFSEWKGVDIVIHAIVEVKLRFPELRVLLVGAHDHQKGYFQQLLTELNLDDTVDFHGRIPHVEIAKLLLESKIGLVPISYQEDGLLYTSPLKLYEYLASGLVVVAARVPSLMVSIPEELVYWAVPDSVESYAKTIISALESNEFDSKNGIEFARDLTWIKRGEKLKTFLNVALEAK